jgi:hypothetical protein
MVRIGAKPSFKIVEGYAHQLRVTAQFSAIAR